MMKIIYTNNPKAPKDGEVYRLLGQFFGVISSAQQVMIEGDAPHIVEAYEKAGIKVSATSFDGPDKELTIAEIKQALEDKGVEIPKGVTKRDDLLELLDGEGIQ